MITNTDVYLRLNGKHWYRKVDSKLKAIRMRRTFRKLVGILNKIVTTLLLSLVLLIILPFHIWEFYIVQPLKKLRAKSKEKDGYKLI